MNFPFIRFRRDLEIIVVSVPGIALFAAGAALITNILMKFSCTTGEGSSVLSVVDAKVAESASLSSHLSIISEQHVTARDSS